MSRFYLVAAVGLCSLSQVNAQQGTLAPTAPVVPSPVVQNGNLLTPAGGNGSWGTTSGPRVFANTKWAPFQNTKVTPSVGEPVGVPSAYGYPVPPVPAGVGGADGLCGQGGCAQGRAANGSCWDKFKNWACYHPSKTELPKFQPTPYITPLQGMFPCTSVANCGTGCGSCAGGYDGRPWHTAPGGQAPAQPIPQAMPAPMQTGAAGPVAMPPRGAQGAAIAPTWQGRVTPAPASTGIAGYRFATPEATQAGAPAALPGTIVNTSGKYPQR